MKIKQLETFYWAAKLGSFTAAAERLHATQSTISMRIRDLEEDFGVELFDRAQRSVRLTPRGRELIRYAERMLNLSAEIRQRICSPDSIPGSVRLGVAEMISLTWLPVLIRTLHERHPKIVLELDEALTGTLIERMRAGNLDVILAPAMTPAGNLGSRSLGGVAMAWMASPNLDLPGDRLGPTDLQDCPVIALSPQSVHHASIEDWFRSGGTYCHRLYTCKSFGVASSLAIAGLGVTLLPIDLYRDQIDNGLLRVVETDPPMVPVEFFAMTANTGAQPLAELIADLAQDVSTFDRS